MLSNKGWIVTFLIASLIVFSGLMSYLLFPLAFLILGSLMSKLNPKNEDNAGRNHIQVFANAGVAGVIAILYYFHPIDLFTYAFVISFSVALSDTFSSEIGKRFGGQPIDIITFTSIPKGISGGITLFGSLGGALGSAIMAIIYFLFQGAPIFTIYVFTFGFLGMIIDSILGSLVQAKYQIESQISEKGNKTQLISGFHSIDNNAVNFLSIFITVLIFGLFYYWRSL